MNRLVLASLTAAMMAAPLMADESFGGIGVTIYQVREGVHVVEVIPGTPAAETKLQAGDVITAVDGVSLAGKTIDESKDLLRGTVNKPLEVTYKSEGEVYSTVIRRAQMTVKDLDGKSVQAWYGDKQEFNSQELETYASASQSDKQLVAVLQNGSVVNKEASVKANGLNGIYVEKAKEFEPKIQTKNVVRNGDVLLRGFTRKAVSYSVKTPGKTIVTILNADGEQVAKIVNEGATAGVNTVAWNAENIPSGRYMVSIDHNGRVSGTIAALK
ncbi:MAG: PDZ domain-containing protein [Fibrobacter sp.]|nr:PDZ domain-containing protein [Fibrobacter sp.]